MVSGRATALNSIVLSTIVGIQLSLRDLGVLLDLDLLENQMSVIVKKMLFYPVTPS